jgi:hypothetical protein
VKKWLRFVLPIGVVVAGTIAPLVVHSIEQPDPSDPSFLSPVSTEADGAADLADRLAAEGVTVDRRTKTPEAIAAVTSAPESTLFVPAPQMIYPDYLRALRIVPPSVRVVLVTPSTQVLRGVGVPAPVIGPRWTAAAPHSGCSEQFAARPAAVLRWQYGDGDSSFSCYQGAVVEFAGDGPAVTLVGASDPFRNDRQGEWANAGFATGLLSRGSRVVWLDLHEREQPPPDDPLPDGEDPGLDPRPGQSGAGDSDGGTVSEPPDNGGGNDGDEGRPQSDGSGEQHQNPLFSAFPAAFWAAVLLLVLALLALAAASARRLGAPVPEPLPTPVRAAETVRGLGGLYRRAKARDASLTTVRAAAVQRLAAHFGVPPEQLPAHLLDALGDGHAEDDDELAEKAAAIQRLVRDVIEGNQQ